MDSRAPVLCLLGPTASGKTEAAITLHQRGDIDVISVDSAMVYRGFDIGSAKPDVDLLRTVPHQLVDVREPFETYSVADFVDDATKAIRRSHAAGRVPLLVGGTMLYFLRLFDGLASLPAADPQIRTRLDAEAASLGWPALHARLATIDPQAAARIAPADAQRIQRALEVYEMTSTPISQLQQQRTQPSPFNFCRLALINNDRSLLHARISERFDQMLADGFVAEVAGLLARPRMSADLPSMRAVGYRQLARHLSGEIDLPQAVADAKTATRRLAKRQFTWLRGMSELNCVDPLESGASDRISVWTDDVIAAGCVRG